MSSWKNVFLLSKKISKPTHPRVTGTGCTNLPNRLLGVMASEVGLNSVWFPNSCIYIVNTAPYNGT